MIVKEELVHDVFKRDPVWFLDYIDCIKKLHVAILFKI